MHKFLFLIYIIMISGCAVNPINLAPQSFSKQDNYGLIAGTISIIAGKPKFSSYDFYYREIEHNKNYKINIQPAQVTRVKLKPDYVIGDTLVFQYIFELKPGNYEFYNYYLFINGGGYRQSTHLDGRQFSVPFTVQNAEISYLGDMIIDTEEFMKTGNLIEWLDNGKRELNNFKNNFPSIDWSTFNNQSNTGVIK